jgi:hypothetical protein
MTVLCQAHAFDMKILLQHHYGKQVNFQVVNGYFRKIKHNQYNFNNQGCYDFVKDYMIGNGLGETIEATIETNVQQS